ncbi:MAG: FHA domain-containing protein [Myxococcota bacterium]|nr:FHA domain-containing protein [Myxococcota bacterium]
MSFFLDLSPEHGGTRFGPFSQGATLGSDPARCHITLPAELGIRSVHAWIVPVGSGLTLQVSEPDAVVYVLSAGRPVPIHSSTAIGSGDSLLLGGPNGVKFTLQFAAPPPAHPTQQKSGRRGPPTASAMAAEAKRQAEVALMTTKSGAQASHFLHRLQSGAFTNPRYVIGAVIAVGGALFTGCSGLLALIMSQL